MSHPINATTSAVSQWLSRYALLSGQAAGEGVDAASLPESTLMERMLSGDREALEQLIARHARAVYSCIRHRVRNRDTADDLFQETWIRVIERCHTYRRGSAVLPWLYRIAINVVNDEARRQMAQRRGGNADHLSLDHAAGLVASPDAPADEVLMQNQQRASLHRAVMALPEPYGEVVRLRYFEELSVADVSDVLDCAEGTVKSRLSRGLTLLQKSLEDQQ